MAILVTGGAGYIGSHTCVELLNAGYELIVADNFYNSKKEVLDRIKTLTNKDFKFYECDIRDKEKLTEIFEKENIESVIHFAGLKSVSESCSKPLEYYNNNVDGTINLCEVMGKAGVKKLVFSSSATVYGMKNKAPFDETMEIGGTTNPYGTTKFMIELILRDLYAADNSWSIATLRYFNPIGAHESGLLGEDPSGIPNNLVPYIAQVAVGKLDKLYVNGDDYDTHDGTGVRDYIHVVDLALGHIAAIEHLGKNGGYEAINLGTGVGYSVFDVLHSYEKAAGKKLAYEITPRRPGDIDVSFAKPDKAKTLLGWTAELNLDDMCISSWNWQKKNPNGYE